ncbi:MAG: hypothetical protein QOF85_449 [Solirubrobacterales bacterium]|nr:hypothetical protein [Solirubrobacterales bacterium]
MSVLGGGTRLSSVFRKTTIAVACGLLVTATGCGGGGVASDATITAYVEAPLCATAKRELASQGGRAGDLRVQATCLPSASDRGKLNLATLGANARQATEDSTAVAYLEAPDPRAARFTHRILETAEVPWISASSGAAAMRRLLQLLESADSASLRKSLSEALHET